MATTDKTTPARARARLEEAVGDALRQARVPPARAERTTDAIIAAAEAYLGVIRPGPDEFTLALCASDGAWAWTTGKIASIEDVTLGSFIPILEESQQLLREDAAKDAG